jgi:2-polyprenyl-6-methoxyphenol hydroxylase-like FAD-dependent oxidoreductase
VTSDDDGRRVWCRAPLSASGSHLPPINVLAPRDSVLCGVAGRQTTKLVAEMRILLVGAGIAWLTLAAFLRCRRQTLLVIDRQPPDTDRGYALTLWPHGSRILHAVAVYGAFLAKSERMRRYTLRGDSGGLISSYETPAAIEQFGELGMIPRGDLIDLLGSALDGVEVRYGVSIEGVSQVGEQVEAKLTDGTTTRFNLVVGADGAHSRVRELLLGRLADHDTGWGCYVWWEDVNLAQRGETTEW